MIFVSIILALCLDHLSSFQQRDGYSNVLGMVRTLEIVLCFLDILMVTIGILVL